jgi:signal transduction histidine kinase
VNRGVQLGLGALGFALAVLAYRVQVNEGLSDHGHALAIVAPPLAFMIAGLAAWARRPANRLGPLMVVAAYALLLRQLRHSHDALLFTTFFLVGDLAYALVGHVILAYPSGRVTDRYERWLMRAGYAAVIVFPFATLLVYDGSLPLFNLDRFFPRDTLINVVSNFNAAIDIQKGFEVVFYGVLFSLFILLIARRLLRATPRARRMLAPLLLAAIALALRGVFECVFTFVDRPFAYDYLFWWQIVAFTALPLAMLAGLLRARLAQASVGELVLRLEHTPPQQLRDVLAETLGDPSLELALWLPEKSCYVDSAGREVELLPNDARRAVTRIEHEGKPLAALVHDPSLLEEPELVHAAGAAARLALENARLQAEMRAQLMRVQESRVRIVAAGDEARRRIERDIHDGAQQRLVALALQLRTAQRRLGESADPEVEALLDAAVDELQVAVDELRELARGVHPAILTEEGLAAALESLASRTPFPVSIEVLEGRFPPQVEATAYFVACEGLANVAKHSEASKAAVTVVRRDGVLTIEVSDDGIGGALPVNGSGLSGLADRVEALGGSLRVESPAGGGTRVLGEIPCGS